MSSLQLIAFGSDNQDPESICRKILRLIYFVFFFRIRSNDQDMSFSKQEVQIFNSEAQHYNLVIKNKPAVEHEIFALYFQANTVILEGKSKEGEELVKRGKEVAKTSKKPHLYTLLLDSPFARVLYMEGNIVGLRWRLRDCFQMIESLGGHVPYSVLGWLLYMRARAHNDRSAAIKDFKNAIAAFNKSETSDKYFGMGHALCRRIICLLRCGETADTVDRNNTPEPEELQEVNCHFKYLENLAVTDTNIVIRILYLMAQSDYKYRINEFEMAANHAKDAHRLVVANDCNEFLEVTMQRKRVYTGIYKDMATYNEKQAPESPPNNIPKDIELASGTSTSAQNAFKVLSRDRMTRKGIVASNFDDLQKNSRIKFGMEPDSAVSLVLEADGVEVDRDYFAILSHNETLVALKEDETWIDTATDNQEQAPKNPPPVFFQLGNNNTIKF